MNRGNAEKKDQQNIAIIIILGWIVNCISFILIVNLTENHLVSFFGAGFFAALVAGALYYLTQEN